MIWPSFNTSPPWGEHIWSLDGRSHIWAPHPPSAAVPSQTLARVGESPASHSKGTVTAQPWHSPLGPQSDWCNGGMGWLLIVWICMDHSPIPKHQYATVGSNNPNHGVSKVCCSVPCLLVFWCEMVRVSGIDSSATYSDDPIKPNRERTA